MKGTRDTKTTPPVTRTPDRAASQSGPMIAHLAALAAVAGIPVHLYWALGGTWGYPGGTATATMPGLRAVNLVVSVLLACGAVYVYGLTRPWALPSAAGGRCRWSPPSCSSTRSAPPSP
jgi:hypothetical protein